MNNKFTLTKNGKSLADDVVELSLNKSEFKESIKEFNYENLLGEEKIITFDGVQIFFGNLHTKGLIDFDIVYNSPLVLLTFEIEGGHKFKTDDGITIKIDSGTCNCVYFPKLNGKMHYTTNKRKYFTCVFTTEFISKLLKLHFPKVGKPYLDFITENKHFKVFDTSKEIPNVIHKIIKEVINCYYEDEVKEIFIISKITEIFVELFTEFKQRHSINEDEILAEKTKVIIELNFNKKITLDEIAQKLTTNKTKLKTAFKNKFGSSIISYKTNIQMLSAKKMIDSKNYSIAEVAYKVGYKNPQHFSTAFKKTYNTSPSEYKKSIL